MLTRIRRLSDNRTIGSYNETSDAWGRIMETVNEEWPCWPDEVDIRTRDDGTEKILVRGRVVARRSRDGEPLRSY